MWVNEVLLRQSFDLLTSAQSDSPESNPISIFLRQFAQRLAVGPPVGGRVGHVPDHSWQGIRSIVKPSPKHSSGTPAGFRRRRIDLLRYRPKPEGSIVM
jgi:hypothetical protein